MEDYLDVLEGWLRTQNNIPEAFGELQVVPCWMGRVHENCFPLMLNFLDFPCHLWLCWIFNLQAFHKSSNTSPLDDPISCNVHTMIYSSLICCLRMICECLRLSFYMQCSGITSHHEFLPALFPSYLSKGFMNWGKRFDSHNSFFDFIKVLIEVQKELESLLLFNNGLVKGNILWTHSCACFVHV